MAALGNGPIVPQRIPLDSLLHEQFLIVTAIKRRNTIEAIIIVHAIMPAHTIDQNDLLIFENLGENIREALKTLKLYPPYLLLKDLHLNKTQSNKVINHHCSQVPNGLNLILAE